MTYDCFKLDEPSNDLTLPAGMTGWYEVFDSDETNAWIASDTTMEVRS